MSVNNGPNTGLSDDTNAPKVGNIPKDKKSALSIITKAIDLSKHAESKSGISGSSRTVASSRTTLSDVSSNDDKTDIATENVNQQN